MTMELIKTEQKRFLSLLEIVRREGDLLLKTDARLFKVNLDVAWVERLDNEEDLAERLDAFVSRFGCMQDTVDKPALIAAQLSARMSRAMQGRKVDVLIIAPNLLRLPIHDIAFKEGRLL